MTINRNVELLKSFGNNVKRIRLEMNMSQYELAAYSNMEQSQIRRIEGGQINTTISTAQSIANAFNIELYELFKF